MTLEIMAKGISRQRISVSARELAQILGLSTATVSYVLNGVGLERKVAQKTIKRVEEAAVKHNCVINKTARSLKRKSSGMIGVILGNLRMDWAENILESIYESLEGTDYVAFMATNGFEPQRNRKEILSSLHRRDEGIITFPITGCDDIYESLAKAKVPLVFLGDELPGYEKLVCSVVWDPTESIHTLIDHLIETGRRRIAFLGIDYAGLSTKRRIKAFQQAIRKHGLQDDPHLLALPPASDTPQAIVKAGIRQFMSHDRQAPDAIIALNDGLALPALEYLDQQGIKVPQDIALAGMGDLPLTSHSAISLTTIKEPTAEMGTLATKIILDLINGNITQPAKHSIPTSEIIIRRTTSIK